MDALPPKVLVKTWLFLAARSEPEFKEAQPIAIKNIRELFETTESAIKYVES